MAATKKSTTKKAKAPAKKPAVAVARAPRKPRKQAAATPVSQANYSDESSGIMILVSLFAALSVLFALMTYWRYYG